LWRVAKRELTGSARTPEEQTEFIKVFSDLLEQTYVNKIESYNNEKFIYLNERIDEPYAEVGSKIQTSKGEEFTINYKLHRVGADWRVYDVVIEKCQPREQLLLSV